MAFSTLHVCIYEFTEMMALLDDNVCAHIAHTDAGDTYSKCLVLLPGGKLSFLVKLATVSDSVLSAIFTLIEVLTTECL